MFRPGRVILLVTGTSGSLINRYVYGVGIDEVLIKVPVSGNISYIHHNHIGSVVAITDNTGAVTSSYSYSPWGESNSLSGSIFGYTGQRFDSETGLYYYKARHYSPALGRFLQPDPIGYAGGMNLYEYANSEPVGRNDPLGLKSPPSTGGGWNARWRRWWWISDTVAENSFGGP